MSTAYRCLFIVCVAALPAATGCKKETPTAGGGAAVSAEDIAAVRDTLTGGMTRMAIDDLKAAHVGKKCVVTAHTPAGGYRSTPPPPPPGMVRLLGETIIYSGEFDDVSDDSVTVRAAYPTAGNYKRIEILRDDIQSFHLAQ
ncbi:MAG: hypothetical protein JSW27_12660 [Phycisphaerales bacterium]|nr:MAG: hypothetical protein JSW27_12660 [Phycisphaerales bacterium]